MSFLAHDICFLWSSDLNDKWQLLFWNSCRKRFKGGPLHLLDATCCRFQAFGTVSDARPRRPLLMSHLLAEGLLHLHGRRIKTLWGPCRIAERTVKDIVGTVQKRKKKVLRHGGDLQNRKKYCIAVIGDGAITGGMAYEALNHAGFMDLKNMIIILNDNQQVRQLIFPKGRFFFHFLKRLLRPLSACRGRGGSLVGLPIALTGETESVERSLKAHLAFCGTEWVEPSTHL